MNSSDLPINFGESKILFKLHSNTDMSVFNNRISE